MIGSASSPGPTKIASCSWVNPWAASPPPSPAGKTTQAPSLWLYSENDLYWSPDAPKQWHKAHVDAATAAGQKQVAEFFAAQPVEPDGHRLLTVGGRLWSPPLNAWLKKHGF